MAAKTVFYTIRVTLNCHIARQQRDFGLDLDFPLKIIRVRGVFAIVICQDLAPMRIFKLAVECDRLAVLRDIKGLDCSECCPINFPLRAASPLRCVSHRWDETDQQVTA